MIVYLNNFTPDQNVDKYGFDWWKYKNKKLKDWKKKKREEIESDNVKRTSTW